MRHLLTGVLVALALAGCSSAPARIGDQAPRSPDSAEESQYREIFDRWSRHEEVYDQLDTRMFVAATLESPEFVKARAERIALFKGMEGPEAQKFVTSELADASRDYTVFIGLHTNTRKVNDLDPKNGIWRVTLQTSTGSVEARDIDRISKPDDTLRGVYFYLADFWVGYRVHFPPTLPDGRPLVAPGETQATLHIDSAIGHAKMDFPVQPVVLPLRPLPVDAGSP